MNTFTSTLYRDATCAVAATLITVAISLTFVESTATVPGANAVGDVLVMAPLHGWIGQPEPAVLVD